MKTQHLGVAGLMPILLHLWSAGLKWYMASVQFSVGTGPCPKTATHVGMIPKQSELCGQKWDRTGNKEARGQEAGAMQAGRHRHIDTHTHMHARVRTP